MIAQGTNGRIELHEHHIVIRRQGMLNGLRGLSGEKSIPLSSITAIQFGARYIQFSILGDVRKRVLDLRTDENAVLFRRSQVNEFQALRTAMQEAIHLPSLATLASQASRQRVSHSKSSDASSGGEEMHHSRADASREPRRLETSQRALAPPSTGFPPNGSFRQNERSDTISEVDAIKVCEPKPFFQWVKESSLSSKILVSLFAFLIYVIISGIDPLPPASSDNSSDNAAPKLDETSADQRQQHARVGHQPNPWVGSYKGGFDGANGTVEIKELPNRRLSINLAMVSPSCTGGIDATVKRPKGSKLTIAMPVDEQGYRCRLNLERENNWITLKEDDCGAYHGMSCGFDGEVQR